MKKPTSFFVARFWSPHLVLLFIEDGEVVNVRRHRISRSIRTERAKRHILSFARDHDVWTVLVEPGFWLGVILTAVPELTVIPFSSEEAKEQLLEEPTDQNNIGLVNYAIERDPRLKRFMTVADKETGEVSMTRPWQMVVMIAAAVGFAHADRLQDDEQQPTEPMPF